MEAPASPAPRRRRTATPTGADDRRYLQRIGSRWHARIPVPSHLRPKLGPYLRKALDTSDFREAQKRRWDFLEVARARFAEAAAVGKPAVLAEAERSYEAFRAKLAKAGPAVVVNAHTGEEMANPNLEALIELAEEEGIAGRPEIAAAIRDHVANREPVSATLKSYLEANPKRSATTAANYGTTVRLWTEKHGDGALYGATRKMAVEWLEGAAEGKARETVKRYATVMGTLWEWAHRLEEPRDRPANPFDDLLKAIGSKAKPSKPHGHYNDEELKQAFAAVADDKELRPMFLLSVYTGFRLDECLRATREDINGLSCFVLRGGKTDNASRIVPVHPKLRDVAAPSGVKASALSVRYGRLMRGAKLRRGLTFHSLRKAFTTGLERVDCPEAIAARIIGQAPLSITYRLYSQGREAATYREWVEKVQFPI